MKKYGYAVYSSMLGGILVSYETRKDCSDFITEYYAANGTGERLTIIDNYPL